MRYNTPACEQLSRWLYAKGLDWRYGISDYEIDVARNKNVLEFLKSDKQYLLMINHDMVPLPETNAILTADGDVVYCGSYSSRGTPDHIGDKQFNSACWRVHRRVFESFGPPWFRVGHSGDVTERTYCDCNYFKDRCNDAGFDSHMVGLIAQRVEIVLFPDPADPASKWKFFWAAGMDYEALLTKDKTEVG
jgi:hypothetical protein